MRQEKAPGASARAGGLQNTKNRVVYEANVQPQADKKPGWQQRECTKLIERSDLPAPHRAIFKWLNEKAVWETGEVPPAWAKDIPALAEALGFGPQTIRIGLANLRRHGYHTPKWPNPHRGQKSTEGTVVRPGTAEWDAITPCPVDCPDRSKAQRLKANPKAKPKANPKANPSKGDEGTPFEARKGVPSFSIPAGEPPFSSEVLVNEVNVRTRVRVREGIGPCLAPGCGSTSRRSCWTCFEHMDQEMRVSPRSESEAS